MKLLSILLPAAAAGISGVLSFPLPISTTTGSRFGSQDESNAQAQGLPGSTNGRLVQKQSLVLPPAAQERREAVQQLFRDSYSAYKKHAFGHDDLSPVSQSFFNGRNGWGATIIDALSTAIIMNETEIVNEAIGFATNINFNVSKISAPVSVFESTIRYMGGLLSAYDLTGRNNSALLGKAKELADKLSYAWVSPNQQLPYSHLNFTTNEHELRTSNIAEAGSLIVEWATLSGFTGELKYGALAEKAFRHIATLPAPLPGLAAQDVDPSTGASIGGYVTWGGGSDSYFEYLIKYARLSNTDDNLYADTWATAVDSSIRTLLKKSTVGNYSYLADYDDQRRILHVSSHLACFHGGNWLYGGKLLNNQTIIDIGLDLIDACWNTYSSTSTGIGPETFAFKSNEGNFTGLEGPITPNQEEFYAKHGFYITQSYYDLRPEVLESNFYAWRITGDTKYLKRASSALDSFIKYLPAAVGYGGIHNVQDNINHGNIDDTESFWFAETLKYLYLTFDDPSHINLDEWVLNTEAHPFSAPPPKRVYGSGRPPAVTSADRFASKTPSRFSALLSKLPVPNPSTIVKDSGGH